MQLPGNQTGDVLCARSSYLFYYRQSLFPAYPGVKSRSHVRGTGEGKQLGNESLGEQDELIPFPRCFLFSDNKDKQIDHFCAGSNGLLIADYFL